MKKVRTRFAPSPTGPLHMGGVRTALYCYLFAKKNNGDFILRIEDTDQKRYVQGAQDYIIEALNWCGISPDEGIEVGGELGPYRQSERKEIYQKFAQRLIKSGHAYYAFDTPEDLEQMREKLIKAGVDNRQYNANTRSTMKNSLTLSTDEVKQRLDSGEKYVIRLKVPENEEIRFEDLVRGWVVVHSSNIDDKVIFKGDGMPTYHLANVVDDHLMEITHVIRGEEWLPSAPLHILLYKYLGWEDSRPEFAHLPLILKPDGNGKLSKRDGDRLGFPVFPLNWIDPVTGSVSPGYKEQGYFPDAFINMLALMGWNPGDNREIFSLDELVDEFTLERVNKAGAKFDPDKTRWFQQQYLRNTSDDKLADLFIPVLKDNGIDCSDEYAKKVCGLMKERVTFVADMLLDGRYLFEAPESYDEKTIRKKWKERTPGIMVDLIGVLQGIEDFNAENVENEFKVFLEKKELGFGAVLPNFRVLVTGMGMGPSMFVISELLGKDEVISRIETGLKKLDNANN
ncbi:MAG: glutamate--tRNA ligase [Bacteroidetes bacterium]|nr:MAG: glutamate--tRNA ligase [Bacteroidota bacterium]